MAAVRTKSFFSSPANTFKRLVNAFPKSQKPSLSQLLASNLPCERQIFEPSLAVECEYEETCEDETDVPEVGVSERSEGECVRVPFSSAANDAGTDAVTDVEDDTNYSSSGEDEYLRPRIRPDLLPHDFSAWQKSPSIASSTSRDGETFSDVLSSSTSQEMHVSHPGLASNIGKPRSSLQEKHIFDHNFMENGGCATPSELQRNPALRKSLPLFDLQLQEVRTKLPDLKPDTVAQAIAKSCKYGVPAAREGFPDECWTMEPGASEERRQNYIDRSCQQRRNVLDPSLTASRVQELMEEGATLHQHFGDVAPFVKSFTDGWDDGYQRNNFQHHASMVYTRAPSREALVKKIAYAANARRGSRNLRKLNKKSGQIWQDQENQSRQARGPHVSCSPRRASSETAVDISKLQGQVEELQHKLLITEGVLQSYHGVPAIRNEGSNKLFLESRVAELESTIGEKDRLLELAQEALTLKETEVQALQRHIRDAEETSVVLSARTADSEEKLMTLKCEVAALRWQTEVEAERIKSEIKVSEDNKEMHDLTAAKVKGEWDTGETEVMRNMYLAGLVVARFFPRDECFALVHILRTQLQCLVKIPPMRLP